MDIQILLFDFVIFFVSSRNFVATQLFQSHWSKNFPANFCSVQFINVDIVSCGSFTHENLESGTLLAGYQLAKISTEEFYTRSNELKIVPFKYTLFIFTPGSETELNMLSYHMNKMFSNPLHYNSSFLAIFVWPSIIYTRREENNLEQELKQLALTYALNENVFIMYQRTFPNSSSTVILLEIYSIKNISFVQKVPRTKTNLINCYSFAISAHRRTDFKGAVIRATAVENDENAPVASYATDENGEVHFTEGLGVSGLSDIRFVLNFSVEAVKGDEDIYVINNTVQGIGRQLIDDEADVSVLHSYTLLPNIEHLTPLLPWGADKIYAFFIQPASSTVRNIFQKPFTVELWTTLWIAWLLIITCIFAIGFFEKQLRKFDENVIWPQEETSLWAVGVLCQRSFYINPTTAAMRIIFLSGLYMSMITFTSYSAAIISSLTAESLPINSLDDLIYNNFEVISDPSMFYSYFLSQDNAEEFEKLSQAYIDDDEATRKTTEGRRMFLTSFDTLCLSSRMLNYTDQEICNTFHKVPLGKVAITSGFYVKKRSPFKKVFNLKMLIVMERGLNARYIQNYYLSTLVKCTKKTTSYRENLGLNDVFTAFLILCIGCGVSLILLVLEKLSSVTFRKFQYQI